MLSFEQPLLLLLLLPVSVVVFLTWRRMSLPFPKGQRRLILGCRLALFALIICALAGAIWSQPVARQTVVFVGDISDSTGPQRIFIEQWINGALRHKRPDDQVGIVAVGRNALVEQSVRPQIDFQHFQSTPDTTYTDLAAGLRLASAILPADTQRRIVLLTDGQQNLGDALQEAQLLQQEGIRLDIVSLPTSNGVEARIDGLTAPTELHSNERFLLHVKLYTSVAQSVTLRLYLDRALLSQQVLQLAAGQQEVVYGLLAPPAGFHTLRVTLQPSQDTIAGNNEAAAFINVQGPPRVLVIEGSPGEGHNIIAALRATGLGVVVGTPNDVPVSLDGLANYASVVLADVPAVELGTTRMQVLQSFVRDLGRGLVVSGGENSYGVGGYANTPLEQTLPVKMDIPQHKDTPAIAVVLIIESLENDTGVNISKEAAKGVINLLTPRDQVGISAAYGTLAIPMQHVTDRAAIDKAIDAMNPNDPGSYLPDLINAENVLLHTDAKIKHVILLGDGDATDNYQPQAFKMANEHITISTVATNAQSYDQLNTMAQIAFWGKGRFYRADDPATIPQILLKETQQAARRAVIEEPFVPAIVGNQPILTGLGPLPGLNGYVATTPKPAAQLVLISHRDDPVLAVWQYGLGRVAAWTSDALGLWTARWLSWDGAARWWANLVTWTLPTPDNALNVNAVVVGSTGQLTVDLPPGTPVGAGTQQQVQAIVITPDLHQQTVTLQPTAPGRWQGGFPTGQVGAYLLRITWQAGDKGSAGRLSSTTGLVVPYSPEYRSLGTDTRFLTLLARAGGGQLLGASDYQSAFIQNLPPVSASLPITFWLLALAALLLPVDIAARRLVSLEFLALGLRWLKGTREGRPLQARAGEPLKDTLIGSTLGTVRAQREERRQRVSSPPPRAASSEARVVTPTTVQKPAPRGKERSPSKVAPPAVSVSEQLLEAKRQRARERARREDIQP